MKRIAFIILALIFSVNSSAEDTLSLDFQVGNISPTTTDLLVGNNDFHKKLDEQAVQLNLQYRLSEHFLVYGKAHYHEGETDVQKQWSQASGAWDTVEPKMDVSSSFWAGGIKAEIDFWGSFSVGTHFGFGHLNKPDNIYNSDKGQFDVGAEITYSFHKSWEAIISWNHISNGRQIFNRGGSESDFYPNNGRDYINVGVRYHIF